MIRLFFLVFLFSLNGYTQDFNLDNPELQAYLGRDINVDPNLLITSRGEITKLINLLAIPKSDVDTAYHIITGKNNIHDDQIVSEDPMLYMIRYRVFRYYQQKFPERFKVTYENLKRHYLETVFSYITMYGDKSGQSSIIQIYSGFQKIVQEYQNLGHNVFEYSQNRKQDGLLRFIDLTPNVRSLLDLEKANRKIAFNQQGHLGRYIVRAAYERKHNNVYIDFSRPFHENIVELAHEITHATDIQTMNSLAYLYRNMESVNSTLEQVRKENNFENDQIIDVKNLFLEPYFFSLDFDFFEKHVLSPRKKQLEHRIEGIGPITTETYETIALFCDNLIETTIGNEFRAYTNSYVLFHSIASFKSSNGLSFSQEELTRAEAVLSRNHQFLDQLIINYSKIFQVHDFLKTDRTWSFFGVIYYERLLNYKKELDSKLITLTLPAPQISVQGSGVGQLPTPQQLSNNAFNVLSRKLGSFWVERYLQNVRTINNDLISINTDSLLILFNTIDMDLTQEILPTFTQDQRSFWSPYGRAYPNALTAEKAVELTRTETKKRLESWLAKWLPKLTGAVIGVNAFLKHIAIHGEGQEHLSKLIESWSFLEEIYTKSLILDYLEKNHESELVEFPNYRVYTSYIKEFVEGHTDHYLEDPETFYDNIQTEIDDLPRILNQKIRNIGKRRERDKAIFMGKYKVNFTTYEMHGMSFNGKGIVHIRHNKKVYFLKNSPGTRITQRGLSQSPKGFFLEIEGTQGQRWKLVL